MEPVTQEQLETAAGIMRDALVQNGMPEDKAAELAVIFVEAAAKVRAAGDS